MKYESTMTSKGTVTIAAPLRKALKLEPGQKIRMELDRKSGRIVMDGGVTIEHLEKIRDEILSKYPDRPKGLTIKAMRDMATKKWLSERK
jgi:bifunctional DNA-binding transcriptional regulator/antitoxin component of YhaV-PrlF toxin-antitoxin module